LTKPELHDTLNVEGDGVVDEDLEACSV
jgi:hypothetical protein